MNKNLSVTLILIVLGSMSLSAQQERKDIRDGNRMFRSEKYSDSEVAYRKALDQDALSIPGTFNLGDALYRQEKFEDAGTHFNKVINNNVDKSTKAQAFHNLGNSYLQAGKIDEAIEAYKNALRNVPDDMNTKYNLAYAQNLKKQQEQQQQQNQDQNQDQDKQDQNQDQQNQDQQNQDQQNQDQQNQDQQNQDQQNQQNQEEQQQPQQQEGKISKEDAQRLLEALANDEKKVQEKVKEEKAKAKRVRVLKDW